MWLRRLLECLVSVRDPKLSGADGESSGAACGAVSCLKLTLRAVLKVPDDYNFGDKGCE